MRKQTAAHTFVGEEVVEEEARVVVGNLEARLGYFYNWKGERHQGELMAGLMGAYGMRRLAIRNRRV